LAAPAKVEPSALVTVDINRYRLVPSLTGTRLQFLLPAARLIAETSKLLHGLAASPTTGCTAARGPRSERASCSAFAPRPLPCTRPLWAPCDERAQGAANSGSCISTHRTAHVSDSCISGGKPAVTPYESSSAACRACLIPDMSACIAALEAMASLLSPRTHAESISLRMGSVTHAPGPQDSARVVRRGGRRWGGDGGERALARV
jgi:hypothetical protein